jgi:uncharacterized protein (TIGR03437 family)
MALVIPVWLALAILAPGIAAAAGPSYTAAGIVNASNYGPGPFAPNSVISIFGNGLARSTQAAPGGVLLPVELNYVQVFVENQRVPLLFVSEGQFKFVMSSVVKPGPVTVRVVTQGLSGPEIPVTLVDCAPNLFAAPGGFALATSADNNLLTADAPAHAGDIVVIYLTGLGRTSPAYNAGEVPGSAAQIVSGVKVALDTMELDPIYIKYAGVTPGWPGLYQLNLEIPMGAPADPELKITGSITTGGLKLAVR